MNLFDRFFRGKVEKIEDKITSVKSKSESAIQNLLSLPPLSQIRTMNISATVTRETQDDNLVVVRIVFKDIDTGHEAMNVAMTEEDARSFANSILEVIDYKEPEVVEKEEKRKHSIRPDSGVIFENPDQKIEIKDLTLTPDLIPAAMEDYFLNQSSKQILMHMMNINPWITQDPNGGWHGFHEKPNYSEKYDLWSSPDGGIFPLDLKFRVTEPSRFIFDIRNNQFANGLMRVFKVREICDDLNLPSKFKYLVGTKADRWVASVERPRFDFESQTWCLNDNVVFLPISPDVHFSSVSWKPNFYERYPDAN